MSTTDNSTSYQVAEFTFDLQRYPVDKRSQLRAWDAADHYLLNVLSETDADLQHMCILNDNFGALTLPLLKHLPICYGDSWMSLEAIRRNIKANTELLDDPRLDFESDLEYLLKREQRPNVVIGRVPKSKSQLAYLLRCLNQWVSPACVLLLAGMDKHLSKGQYELLEKHFGPASFLPGVKKARVWRSVVDKSIGIADDVNAFELANPIKLPDFGLVLKSLPNVFSQDHLDIGSRFFLEQFQRLPAYKQVADLACGNGVLGLSYLKLHPESRMVFYDESFQAVRSAQLNQEENLPDANAEFVASDGLKKAKTATLDLVLCNPPFHQQNTVSTAVTQSFFKDAKRALVPGGEIWIIANRHLGYHSELKRIFGNFENVASNKKFVVLRARR